MSRLNIFRNSEKLALDIAKSLLIQAQSLEILSEKQQIIRRNRHLNSALAEIYEEIGNIYIRLADDIVENQASRFVQDAQDVQNVGKTSNVNSG